MLSSLSASTPTLVWRQADDDFYVATLDGQYAGFVTTGLQPTTFAAESGRGADLGAHASPAAAAAAVAAAARPAASRPVPRPDAARGRRRSSRNTAGAAATRPAGRAVGPR
ncbi:hypothetical protein [Microbacterium radiodurans]|uniref:Uncharacterized protein n=1 Tax=Microbacterium radiodurans TaxID=661398 RepID=A0A5J5IQW8_9MICO|nr:hypothetical protein [Microbacterium radiodurans]KAA9085295.1 hypothetical protein F6B42_12550 [Microbacterium radiodurans]